MKKKILSMILMLCLMITLFPATVPAIINATITSNISVNGADVPCTYTILSDAADGNPGTVAIGHPANNNPAIPYTTQGDVVIPSQIVKDGATYLVTGINYAAFTWCEELTSFVLPESITYIGEASFKSCSKLTRITIPQNVDTIKDFAFLNSDILSTVEFKGNAPANFGNYVFSGLPSDFKIIIPEGATGYSGGNWDELQEHILRKLDFTDQADYDISASAVGTAIPPIDISNGVSGGVAPYTFTASGLPAGITISNAGIISGTPTAASAAGTATITVTDNNAPANTASITIDYGAVTASVSHNHNYNETVWKTDTADHWHECIIPDCTALKKDLASHTPGEWIVDKAATAAQAGKKHQECTVCKAVTAEETIPAIPKTIRTFTAGIYNYAVTSADGAKTATVELKGFARGKSASKVTVKKTVTYQGKTYNITGIADKAFYKNKNLREINISNSVTDIDKKAFYGCTKLTNVILGNKVSKIENFAFYKCTELKKVTIGTGLKTIGEHVFCHDKKLSSLTIKSTKLTKVGKHNLYKCRNLKIKVSSSKIRAYTKLFKNQGKNSNVKVTK